MSESRLSLVLTVKGSEATLRRLKNLLEENRALCGEIAALAQQKLVDNGVEQNIELKLSLGQIRTRVESSGGLGAQEWLETGEVAGGEMGTLPDEIEPST